ncbi:hypothetical protein AUTU_48960 (plasmid) [Aureibacter tunicatorum]|nr:hypothetical protein AUTU_48960 [Aureibacter tunicatorum]
MFNGMLHAQDIIFNVSVEDAYNLSTETVDDDNINIYLSLKSETDQEIVLDLEALCFQKPVDEKIDLSISHYDSWTEILSLLVKTQFIIENQRGKFNFFSGLYYVGEYLEFTFPDECNEKEKIFLEKNIPNEITLFNLRNFYKVESDDKIVRLHYLFKPTEEESEDGFKPLILTSNWFDLYPTEINKE